VVKFVAGAALPWSGDTSIWRTHSATSVCRPTLKVIWWPRSLEFPGVSSTLVQRPCALDMTSVPSGVVPSVGGDGHGWSFFYLG
jgi:hypothetical protein